MLQKQRRRLPHRNLSYSPIKKRQNRPKKNARKQRKLLNAQKRNARKRKKLLKNRGKLHLQRLQTKHRQKRPQKQLQQRPSRKFHKPLTHWQFLQKRHRQQKQKPLQIQQKPAN